MKKKVGLIGAGLMGCPMAKNWLKKGFQLGVLPHKNKKHIDELLTLGAIIASSHEDLCNKSDVIILMLPTSHEVESNTKKLKKHLKPHNLVIDMSTSDPANTRTIYAEYKNLKLRFFDSPVTGGVKGAETGTLTLFVGGPKEWFEESKEVLNAVSQIQRHFGSVGNGHVAKVINNFICVANLAVFSEALPLAARMGLDAKAIFEVLDSGMASSAQLRFKLAHALKDLKLAKNLAKPFEVELPVLEGSVKDFERASLLGLGEKNISSVIEIFEKDFKSKFRG
jgi:3-hydroxyisobutyrate dehydrogenase-like beta-hydroxyacid dehydrogenase